MPQAPLGISGWRWMFVAGSLGAAIVWAMRAQLPESPRWLESVGRTEEAEAIIARMEREAGAIGPLAPPNPKLAAERFAVVASKRPVFAVAKSA